MSRAPVLGTLETDRLILRHRRADEAAIYRQLWTERDPRVPPHRRISPAGRWLHTGPSTLPLAGPTERRDKAGDERRQEYLAGQCLKDRDGSSTGTGGCEIPVSKRG